MEPRIPRPKGEEIPKTSPAEIEHLIVQVQQTNLAPNAKEKIVRLLLTFIFPVNLLQRKNLSIRKLREMVFGPRTEKRKGQGSDGGDAPEAKQGEALIAATQFEREALRCWSCQERYTAPLPEGVKEERYDATADATIALMKYGAGLPFYRQSAVQAMCGVPLSEATMWERCESVADAGPGRRWITICRSRRSNGWCCRARIRCSTRQSTGRRSVTSCKA